MSQQAKEKWETAEPTHLWRVASGETRYKRVISLVASFFRSVVQNFEF